MMSQTVSIIVPARNEASDIGACLDSLLAQDYPGIAEILVIDGMSTDGTADTARATAARHGERGRTVRVLENPKRSVTAALNIGIRHARGELLARADAHALFARDYVSQCVKCLNETGAANVGGPARPVAPHSFIGRLIEAIHQSRFGIGAARFRRAGEAGEVDTVWPGCYRREVFERVGLYREELTRSEDIDLNRRLRAAGLRIFLSPDIRAYYRPRKSLRGLLHQNFGNGRAVTQTLFVAARAVSPRHLVPGAFAAAVAMSVACGLTLGTWSAIRFAWAPAGALAIAYGAADLLFAAQAARKRRSLLLGLALLAAFPALHLAYGGGTLWEMLRQITRRTVCRTASKQTEAPLSAGATGART